ncbi:hypothetical protein ACNR9Q_00995 [Maribacter sp. X9]|uniref:hypothetical protein n=1 Tax=Maribacter sp. X9 TaxID=3402159 RepID=UPI003AF34154
MGHSFVMCCADPKKINGVSLVASRNEVVQEQMEAVVRIHANSAAIMPFGFIHEVNDLKIIFDKDRQGFGETREGTKQYIDILHKNGMSVMLKPQIWILKGILPERFKWISEAEWQQLELFYSDFMQLTADTSCGYSLYRYGT